ncbi:MAG: PqqD family protein [Bacillota bacterium]
MYILENEVSIAHLDNELALLNLKTGKYFTLNETGARIWELLRANMNEEEILNELKVEYEIDEAVLEADIKTLIEQLKAAELLRNSDD